MSFKNWRRNMNRLSRHRLLQLLPRNFLILGVDENYDSTVRTAQLDYITCAGRCEVAQGAGGLIAEATAGELASLLLPPPSPTPPAAGQGPRSEDGGGGSSSKRSASRSAPTAVSIRQPPSPPARAPARMCAVAS